MEWPHIPKYALLYPRNMPSGGGILTAVFISELTSNGPLALYIFMDKIQKNE
jgi:hypothetical protein